MSFFYNVYFWRLNFKTHQQHWHHHHNCNWHNRRHINSLNQEGADSLWLDDQRFAEYAAHLERQDWEEEVEEYFSSFLQKKWRHHDHDHCYHDHNTRAWHTWTGIFAGFSWTPPLDIGIIDFLTLLHTPAVIILSSSFNLVGHHHHHLNFAF